MKKNILIIGKGYISKYVKPCLEKNHNIFHISKKTLDYTNPSNLEKYLENKNINWIVNCSGYTGVPNVDACEDHKEECYFYNVTVPLYITNTSNKFDIPVIHIGSGCVYSGYYKVYTELDSTNFGAGDYESSFYSKTKDAFEKISSDLKRYIFRIRIPFNGVVEPKNYLYKLLNYDTLISYKNSITNTDDLVNFIKWFIEIEDGTDNELKNIYNNSVFNVVNNGAIDGYEVTQIMQKYNLSNPNWKFVSAEEANFRVQRSNCVLESHYLEKFNLTLPSVYERMEESIQAYANSLNNKL
jgi:dTDP-4-dehydrorhamnose reductase